MPPIKTLTPERFNGLPVIEVPVKEAIHHPVDLINKVIGGQASRRQGISSSPESPEKYAQESFGRQVYKHLMSGVSNMLPFVVAGGI
ncbi:PTS system protein [Klebsiella michiganensis]|nr:PTS system protein [Klebsiella michiganensis]